MTRPFICNGTVQGRECKNELTALPSVGITNGKMTFRCGFSHDDRPTKGKFNDVSFTASHASYWTMVKYLKDNAGSVYGKGKMAGATTRALQKLQVPKRRLASIR